MTTQTRPRCPKCRGWLFLEEGGDVLDLRVTEWDCLNCGYVAPPAQVLDLPEPDARSRGLRRTPDRRMR